MTARARHKKTNMLLRGATLLRATGLAVVGSVVASVMPHSAHADKKGKYAVGREVVPPEFIENSIKSALASPLFKRVIEHLKDAGLAFDFSSTTVRQSSLLGDVVGLAFETSRTPSPRFGANLLLTANAQSHSLITLQYVISWSLLQSQEITSVIFDANDPLDIDLGGPNRAGVIVPRLFQPHIEQHRSFPRAEPIHPQPEEMVETGWPPELPNYPRWHFSGSTVIDWLQIANTSMPIYAAKTIAEKFSDGSRSANTIDLQYEEKLKPFP